MALISVQVYILLNLCYAKPRSCEFGCILGIDAGLADCTLLFRHTWSSCRHKPCWCWDFRMDRGYWWHPQDHARVGGHYRSLCHLCTTYVKNIQPFLYRLTNHRKLVVSGRAFRGDSQSSKRGLRRVVLECIDKRLTTRLPNDTTNSGCSNRMSRHHLRQAAI